tara:strand:- start:141 stop:470 length:330 start_codon:yes stop_codon:yes gene_type:complete
MFLPLHQNQNLLLQILLDMVLGQVHLVRLCYLLAIYVVLGYLDNHFPDHLHPIHLMVLREDLIQVLEILEVDNQLLQDHHLWLAEEILFQQFVVPHHLLHHMEYQNLRH